MTKNLIVIAEFYPFQNATANCVINICSKIKEKDSSMNFDVLCFKSYSNDFDQSTYQFFRIFRINKLALISKQSYFEKNKKKYLFFKRIIFLFNKVFYKFQKKFSHHPWRLFYRIFYSKIKQLDIENNYDYIIAVSGDYSVSYACSLYKRKNKKKNLITYLTDPLIENPVYANKKGKNKEIDFNFIYSITDKLILPSLIYNSDKYGSKTINLEFPSFYENEEYIPMTDNLSFDSSKINLLYTGIFYSTIRTPDYIMKIIEGMPNNVVLHICGNVSNTIKQRFVNLVYENKLVFHGNLNHQLLYNAICDCDFLVNIGNSTKLMLPSKLISYISTGKPIINIIKINDCPSINYLKNYDDYLNIFESDSYEYNISKLKEYVCSEHKLMHKNDILKKYENFTLDYISNRFYEFVFTKK